MKIKNVNLNYNVLLYDFNKNNIINYNVLRHIDTNIIHKKIKKNEITNYNDLKEYLDREFRYNFSSRSEFEIMVGDLLMKEDKFIKIDAYRQIKMNLDLIVKHVIDEMRIEF